MGIDIHVLNFLRRITEKQLLRDTITIGRQGLNVPENVLVNLIEVKNSYTHQNYCEDLLIEYFGATRVESVDNSDYEQATHIQNFNNPISENLRGKFDSVIDGGCLEHIFNVPQALQNCSLLCKPGGQIIHILPANNFCGHGFWQFSPELFFSLYSNQNGYRDTEVFLAKLSDPKLWFQVKRPSNGRRVNVTSSTEMYVLVRTVIVTSDFSHSNVQQSDYMYEWDRTTPSEAAGSAEAIGVKQRLKRLLKRFPLGYKVLSQLYQKYIRPKEQTGLNRKNPGLIEVRVG